MDLDIAGVNMYIIDIAAVVDLSPHPGSLLELLPLEIKDLVIAVEQLRGIDDDRRRIRFESYNRKGHCDRLHIVLLYGGKKRPRAVVGVFGKGNTTQK